MSNFIPLFYLLTKKQLFHKILFTVVMTTPTYNSSVGCLIFDKSPSDTVAEPRGAGLAWGRKEQLSVSGSSGPEEPEEPGEPEERERFIQQPQCDAVWSQNTNTEVKSHEPDGNMLYETVSYTHIYVYI